MEAVVLFRAVEVVSRWSKPLWQTVCHKNRPSSVTETLTQHGA